MARFPIREDEYFVVCPPVREADADKLRLTKSEKKEMTRMILKEVKGQISKDKFELWKQEFYSRPKPPGDVYEVFGDSPKAIKSALEQLARNFKREMHYKIQYSDLESHRNLAAFIWLDDCDNNDAVDYRAIGACCFRYRRQSERTGWALQWIYIHPNFRNTGLVSGVWDYFLTRFGDFVCETPLSPAFYFYLSKKGFPNKEQKAQFENNDETWRRLIARSHR